jgi:CheY-like chemotaxis protein
LALRDAGPYSGAGTKEFSPVALIAVVDDSQLARRFAAASLKSAGHEVVEIEPASLEQVMDTLRELKPAVLILDQQMPTFSGSSLVRVCFEDHELSSLKVVMLTAHHDEEMERRMEKLGVHSVLHKPIGPLDLNRVVASLTEVPGSTP